MSTFPSNSGSRSSHADENRYQLVNMVAQQAKIILANEPPATASNHSAIREAMRKNRMQRNENL